MRTTTGRTAVASGEAAPRLRRVPAPIAEPPFDDERDGAHPERSYPECSYPERADREAGTAGATQGALALAFSLPSGVPAEPATPGARLRLVSDPPADDEADDFGPRVTRTRDLPAITAWAGRLVQALVEVLGGSRSPSQLLRWTSREVYDSVVRHAARPAHAVRVARCGPAAGASSAAGVRSIPPTVRSVRVCEPVDGVAEVCALIRQHGGRVRAIALRLEGVDGRWQCTALQVG